MITRMFWMTSDTPSVAMNVGSPPMPLRTKRSTTPLCTASASAPPPAAAASPERMTPPPCCCTWYAQYAPTVRISPWERLATLVTEYSSVNASAESERMAAPTRPNPSVSRAWCTEADSPRTWLDGAGWSGGEWRQRAGSCAFAAHVLRSGCGEIRCGEKLNLTLFAGAGVGLEGAVRTEDVVEGVEDEVTAGAVHLDLGAGLDALEAVGIGVARCARRVGDRLHRGDDRRTVSCARLVHGQREADHRVVCVVGAGDRLRRDTVLGGERRGKVVGRRARRVGAVHGGEIGMRDRIGDRLEVVVTAGHVGSHNRDGEVVELLEVLEDDRRRLRVQLREDDVGVSADDVLHLGAVRRLTGRHGDVGDDGVAELLPGCGDRLGYGLLGDVRGEEQRRGLVPLLLGVERHGDTELRVRGAVAPEVLVGVLVEVGATALELGGDLGGTDDQ